MNLTRNKIVTVSLLLCFQHAPVYAALDAEGDVTPTPANTLEEFFVGKDVFGSLSINEGSLLENTNGKIGDEVNSEGTVLVTDTGSLWANSAELFVGSFGTGSLSIKKGGHVFNTHGKIGDQLNSKGSVIVSGVGSQWVNSTELFVGSFGTGTLNIEEGGVVFSTNGKVGDWPQAEGEVVVSGTGSEWVNSAELFVGSFGTGDLKILGEATVTNTNGKIGDQTGSYGSVTVSGLHSLWKNTTELFVGQSGEASLAIQDQGAVEATNTAWVGGDGILHLREGELSAKDLLLYGILDIELGKDKTGSIYIENTAVLGGALEVSLSSDYVPCVGDNFTFLQAADVVSSFDEYIFPKIEGVSFDLVVESDSAIIEVKEGSNPTENGCGIITGIEPPDSTVIPPTETSLDNNIVEIQFDITFDDSEQTITGFLNKVNMGNANVNTALVEEGTHHIIVTGFSMDSSDITSLQVLARLNKTLLDSLGVSINNVELNTEVSGDLNGDFVVNIQDAISIINIVLNGDQTALIADCNGDKEINILDVVCSINLVLNQ